MDAQPRIRVMIVDDHAVVRQGLHSLLADDAAFDLVGEASDGQSALRQVATLHPDVVLLDIRMPGMDGLEVTRRLRADHPDVRIIILTTYAEDEYLVEALRAGAQGYLLKSILYEDLARAIRDVHSGERSLAPDLIGRVMELAGSLARGQAPAPVASTPAPPAPARPTTVSERFDASFGAGAWQRLVSAHQAGASPARLAAQFAVSRQTIRNWLIKGGLLQAAERTNAPDAGDRGLTDRETEVLRLLPGGATNKDIARRLGISASTVKVLLRSLFRKLGVASRSQAAALAPSAAAAAPVAEEPLSERERDIVRMLAAGSSNKDIAAALGISPNTVRVHVHEVFRKLGMTSRAQAVLYVSQQEKREQDRLPNSHD